MSKAKGVKICVAFTCCAASLFCPRGRTKGFAEPSENRIWATRALNWRALWLAGCEVRGILDQIGLACVSAHVPLADLLSDLEGTLDQYVTIGCKYVAIPYLEDERRPGTDGFAAVLKAIPVIGKACKARQMTLLYHNHDFEFVRMPDGSYGLDYLYATVPADLLQTELDTCWVNVAGENPVDYIKKYAGRCPVVHFKDFYMEGPKTANRSTS